MPDKYVLISKHDELKIDVLHYQTTNPKAVVVISHGMAEHKERYIPFMEYLNRNAYACIIHDHRGHGESAESKDDWGYFNDEDADAIVEDLALVIDSAKNLYPNSKVILFGHSMGSMVVRKYLKSYDAQIDALIVCGSPSYNPMSKMALVLISLMEKFKGKRYRSPLIQKLAFGSYSKGIEGDVEERWISYNPDNVEAYHKEEKDGFVFTLNGFKNLFTLMQDIYHCTNWKLENPDLPILFIAGEDDPVIISLDKYQEAVDFLRSIGYNDVTSKAYPKMRHEILNELDARTVFNDITEWLKLKHL